MRIQFETISGSHYEIKETSDGKFIRRTNPDAAKRADGEFVRLHGHFPSPIEEGFPAILELDSLRDYGPDGAGARAEDTDRTTIRSTSMVTQVWTEGEAA